MDELLKLVVCKMKKITLLEASKLVGKTKQTLAKAVKSGKISASKDVNGVFKIDPSELFRVYPATIVPTDKVIDQPATTIVETKPINNTTNQNIELEHRIKILELELSNANKELQHKSVQNDELKTQLKEEINDRKELQAKFNNLLEDKSKKRGGLFSKLFG